MPKLPRKKPRCYPEVFYKEPKQKYRKATPYTSSSDMKRYLGPLQPFDSVSDMKRNMQVSFRTALDVDLKAPTILKKPLLEIFKKDEEQLGVSEIIHDFEKDDIAPFDINKMTPITPSKKRHDFDIEQVLQDIEKVK